ncbi:hypothetical protein IW00_05435 [Pectobacterium brasiliense]|nr:hypothetical protein IW00_05435 [Pectobacterium brasiliense]
MTGIRGSSVACGITRGDRRRDITIGGQHRSRHIHAPGFAIGIDGGLVRLGTDGNGNRITGFDVVVDFTGDGYGLAGLGRINHVIGRDVINRDRRNRCNRIHTVSVTAVRSRDVACRITGSNRGRDITVRCQHRSRYVHAPGFTVGIHRRLVGLSTDFNGNRVTRFDFVANVTRHRNGLTGFAGVNHVIRRDVIDRDRRNWRNGVHAVSVAGIGSRDITRGIARGDRSRDITVRCQHRTGNIHAPGFTIGIHRRLVRFRADGNGDRIARFDFITDLTGDRNRLARFAGVNHVI